MAKRRKSKKTRPLPPRKKRSRAKTLLLSAIAVGLLSTAATYLVIDRRTVRILSARGTSSEPAIYSDSRIIERGHKIRPELLHSELSRRGYREVPSQPQNEGEFAMHNASFEIQTRSFIGPSGSRTAGAKIIYNAETGDIDQSSSDSFTLEPQAIADLSSGESRASRFVPLSKIPKVMQNAVVAVEDERFFKHFGIDLLGIARAIVVDIQAMRLVQGGSTLTQQLAKNVFLSPRRTLGRKFLELFTAVSLETHLTKDQILEFYLNEVYLGQDGPVAVHGVAEAAHAFFGKDLANLTTGECALLAGIIKAPAIFAPRRHLDRALERRDVVLNQMRGLNFIDDKTLERAKAEHPQISEKLTDNRRAPHFTSALRQILSTEYDLDSTALTNLRIFTGLDLELQRCAEQSVSAGVRDLERHNRALVRRSHKLEAGLVAIEPFSGKVRAWAGGRNFSENQFDHVIQAKRAIGSTIKPFVYLTALDGQLNRYKVATVASILSDQPLTISNPGSQDWTPQNYDHRYRGDVTLRYALENSLNIPTVYLAQRVGLSTVANNIERFHVAKEIPAVPSLVLGTVETNLLSLAASYGALANGGVYVKPRPFIAAVDRDDSVISAIPVTEERIAADGPVYVLTNILQGVIERGTATKVRSLGYSADAAGKTGTTDSARDAWFVGFTPDLVAGVWVGYDDNKRVGLTGGIAAVPIWTEFMKCASQFREPLPFIAPQTVTYSTIDAQSGMRATPECPRENTIEEIFVKGSEPISFCSLHGGADSVQRPNLEQEEERNSDDASPRRRRKSLWEQIFG